VISKAGAGKIFDGGGGLGGVRGAGGGGTCSAAEVEGEEGAMVATRARLAIGCCGALTADPILTQRERGAMLESARLRTEAAARREERR
jgi:hypothetical protein